MGRPSRMTQARQVLVPRSIPRIGLLMMNRLLRAGGRRVFVDNDVGLAQPLSFPGVAYEGDPRNRAVEGRLGRLLGVDPAVPDVVIGYRPRGGVGEGREPFAGR